MKSKVVLFTAIGALTYGYAFSVFSTSIGQPGFFAYFDLDPTEKYTQDILGAINAIFSAGASKATTGAPNVAPTRDARAPPREWPVDELGSNAKGKRQKTYR